MFQDPDVRDLLALRREYRERKELLIISILRAYGQQMETITPEQFRDWLRLCVRDQELITEIWEAFEREWAIYQEDRATAATHDEMDDPPF